MKKLLLFFLFLTSPAWADVGVVVQQSGAVISKEVYGGDTSNVSAAMLARQAATPGLTYTIYDLATQAATFNAALVAPSAKDTTIQNDVTAINAAAGKTPLENSLIDLLKQKGIMP